MRRNSKMCWYADSLSQNHMWVTMHCMMREWNRCVSAPPPLQVFVSLELSSGRDVAIQMSVCHPPSEFLLSRAFLRDHMLSIDDIWYVDGAGAEGAHAEFWVWNMLIKYLICIIYSKDCLEHFSGTICPTLMIFSVWVALGPKVHMLKFGPGTYWSPATAGVKND